MTTLRMREEQICFTATHTIPAFPEGDRDRTPHKHEFSVTVEVSVAVDPERGYAFDHRVIENGVADVIHPLEGAHINDVPGLARGLCEDILLLFLVPRLLTYFGKRLAKLTEVELRQVGNGGRHHVKIWRADDNG